MIYRRILLISSLAVAVTVAAATAVSVGSSSTAGARAGDAKREDCRTRGITVAANRTTRLFYTYYPMTDSRYYYTCWIARRQARRVAEYDGQDGALPNLVLAGYMAVHEDQICFDESCVGRVWVADAREKASSGQRLLGQFPNSTPATDLALTARGSVAWIRRDPEGDFRVVVVNPTGRAVQTTVDVGPDVEPNSLAIAGRRVYWTRGGSPRSATLP